MIPTRGGRTLRTKLNKWLSTYTTSSFKNLNADPFIESGLAPFLILIDSNMSHTSSNENSTN